MIVLNNNQSESDFKFLCCNLEFKFLILKKDFVQTGKLVSSCVLVCLIYFPGMNELPQIGTLNPRFSLFFFPAIKISSVHFSFKTT